MSKLSFTVWTCPQVATAADEPNNAVLCVQSYLKVSEVAVVNDYETLCTVCHRNPEIERLTNTRRLPARNISSLSVSLHLGGALNVDLLEFQTNLVLYPRIPSMLLLHAGHFSGGGAPRVSRDALH